MRELILNMTMSIDGFLHDSRVDDPYSLMACGSDESRAWSAEKVLWNSSLHIMGSNTFRDAAAFWPIATNEVLSAPMNQIPKAVFTSNKAAMLADIKTKRLDMTKRGLPTARNIGGESWDNAYIGEGLLHEEIDKLKSQDGKPILAHGGISFARSLAKFGLVDRYIFYVAPVVLRKGTNLFNEDHQSFPLGLYLLKSFPHGLIVKGYHDPAVKNLCEQEAVSD